MTAQPQDIQNQRATKKILSWEDCDQLDFPQVQEMYREFVNPGQVDLIGSFGFGQTRMKSAEGMYIYTTDGRRILDMTGGVGVLNLGHNHPRILVARQKFQQKKLPEVHKNYLSPYVAGLSQNIAQLLPDGLDTSYFCNSGAEAVEGAVKMAYKFHQGRRSTILHADISFHGKLLGAGGLTGSPEVEFDFPSIPGRKTFIYNNSTSIHEQLEAIGQLSGECDIYAIIVEPMSASSGKSCSKEFLQTLREVCDLEKIILIFDEVYTGWGKTGELFHFMKHDVVPDIVTYSKSFGGGKASIAGYTAHREVFMKAYGQLSEAIMHSTTYNAFGEEIVTALEAMKVMDEENLIQRSRGIGRRMEDGLKKLQKKYPGRITEVSGAGAHWAVLLSAQLPFGLDTWLPFLPGKTMKDPRFAAKLITSSVIAQLYDQWGILTYFGSNKEIPLILSPSLIAQDEEIDHVLHALDEVFSMSERNLLLSFMRQKFFPQRK